jgi:uncharacterized protein DUF6812
MGALPFALMQAKPVQRPLFVPTETVAVAVRTADQLLLGLLHARPQKRLKDELNGNSDHFVALTAARVYDGAGSRLLYESAVVLLDSGSIVSVTPLSAVGPSAAAWSKLLAVSEQGGAAPHPPDPPLRAPK